MDRAKEESRIAEEKEFKELEERRKRRKEEEEQRKKEEEKKREEERKKEEQRKKEEEQESKAREERAKEEQAKMEEEQAKMEKEKLEREKVETEERKQKEKEEEKERAKDLEEKKRASEIVTAAGTNAVPPTSARNSSNTGHSATGNVPPLQNLSLNAVNSPTGIAPPPPALQTPLSQLQPLQRPLQQHPMQRPPKLQHPSQQSPQILQQQQPLPRQTTPLQPAINPVRAPFQSSNFNYSEFEAESDPFDSMELKTINELQELAAVLNTPGNQQQQQQFQSQQQQLPQTRQALPAGYSPRFPSVNGYPGGGGAQMQQGRFPSSSVGYFTSGAGNNMQPFNSNPMMQQQQRPLATATHSPQASVSCYQMSPEILWRLKWDLKLYAVMA